VCVPKKLKKQVIVFENTQMEQKNQKEKLLFFLLPFCFSIHKLLFMVFLFFV